MVRRPQLQLLSVVLALLSVGWLVLDGGTGPAAPVRVPGGDKGPIGVPPEVSLLQRWPDGRTSSMVGRMPDGTVFSPMLFVDVEVSFGVAATPDGAAQRLMRRSTDGVAQEVRRVPAALDPQFMAFVVSDGFVYWVEQIDSAQGSASSVWRVPLSGQVAFRITDDVGAGVFFNRQFDLAVSDGRVWWVAAGDTEDPSTEVRSVAVTGGPVQVRVFGDTWLLSSWPWLVSRSGASRPPTLLNFRTGERLVVSTFATEQVACTPVWCRALQTSPGGAVRFDMFKPDGSQRRQIGAGRMQPASPELAQLDRFEVVSDHDGQVRRLLLYDLTTATFTVMTTGVSSVATRGGMVWWSSGDQETVQWYAVDLRTLRP